MVLSNRPSLKDCQKVMQLLVVCILPLSLSFEVMAKTSKHTKKMSHDEMLRALNPYAKVKSRNLSSFMPSDEVITVPISEKKWIDEVMAEDDDGVLKSMQNQFTFWQEQEEYGQRWNLTSTGITHEATHKEKKSYLARNSLKYLDRRVSGEAKRADKNSAIAKVGQMQTALAPNSQVQMSENIRVKFKARLLQGKAMMDVDNPYFFMETTLSANGKLNLEMNKEMKDVGVKTQVNYDISAKQWVAMVNKSITETLSGRVSSTQADKSMMFTDESDRRYELLYSRPF